MASPFRFFRRHQTWFYVVLGVLLMFAFVVLPPVADYLSRNPSGQAKDATVVRWKYGEIKQSELARRMRAEHVIEELQQELFQRALAKKGSPKAAFIRRAQNNRELVQRLLLAKKAESLGIVINEDAILDFFDLISDHSLSNRAQYMALLRKIAKDRVSSVMVLNQLRVDLLAQRMRQIALGSQAAYPPGELWKYYQKLNRMVVCDILPLPAEDYFSEVTQSPSEAELRKIYDEGKDNYPSPLDPKPAFKIRRKASFGYFKADLSSFLDKKIEKLLPTITEEEIKDYYEKNKLMFQEFTAPEETPKAEEEKPKEAPSSSDASKNPKERTGDPKKPSANPPSNDESTPDHPDSQPPMKPSSSGQSSLGSKETSKEKSTKKNGEDPTAEEKGSRKDESASQQSGIAQRSLTHFVAFQNEPQKEEKEQKKKGKDAESPKESAKKSPQKKASQEPKAETQDGTKSGSKTDKENNEAKAASPMAEPTKETPPTEKSDEAASPSKPKIKFRPLDDKLKEEIRRRIAREKATPEALAEMQLALEAARRSVERYANALALANDPELKREMPPVPDFAALAKQYGLTYHTTPPFDLLELQQLMTAPPDESRPYLELFRVTERRNGNFGPTSVRFVDVAARMLNTSDPEDVPLFQPQTIQATGGFRPPEASFLFWIREVEAERVPKFSEVRDEVARYWRQREAFRRASEAAKKLVEQATTAKKPLKEVLSKEQKERLVTTEPFSWMTTGLTGAFPMLSPVRGKNGKGEEVTLRDLGDPFMEKVFDLKPGARTTAHDLPEKTAFAVELVREVTKPEDLRELFLASGNDRVLSFLVQRDLMQLESKWLEQLEEEFEVQWLEDQA